MLNSEYLWYGGAAIAGIAILAVMLRRKNDVVVIDSGQDTASIAQMLAQVSIGGAHAAAAAVSSGTQHQKETLKDALAITAQTATAADTLMQGTAVASLQAMVQSKALDIQERVHAAEVLGALAAQNLQGYGTIATHTLAANTALTQTALEHATAVKLAKLQQQLDILSLNAALENTRIHADTAIKAKELETHVATNQISSQEKIAQSTIEAMREQSLTTAAVQTQALEQEYLGRLISMIAGIPYVPGDYSTLWQQSAVSSQSLATAWLAANTQNLAIASQNYQLAETLKTEREGQTLGFISDIVGSVLKAVAAGVSHG